MLQLHCYPAGWEKPGNLNLTALFFSFGEIKLDQTRIQHLSLGLDFPPDGPADVNIAARFGSRRRGCKQVNGRPFWSPCTETLH